MMEGPDDPGEAETELDRGYRCAPFRQIALHSPAGQRTDLFILRGIPAYIRSDNGPEFIAETVRNWVAAVGAKTAYIEPESP